MTQTMREQIHELAEAVNRLASANPDEPTLLVMAWAFDDAANLAHGRLSHLLNVPASAVPESVPMAREPGDAPEPFPEPTTPGPQGGRPAIAESAVAWAARQSPGSTVEDIAVAAGISRARASTVLNKLHRRGRMRYVRTGRTKRWWFA